MQITIRGKNIETTVALKEYIEKKLSKLEKYFESPLQAQVSLSVERGRHIVEVMIPLDGMLLRGEEETGDMYASVDLVLEKLERQIEKYKTRIFRRLRQAGNKSYPLVPQQATDEEGPRIVRTKKVTLKPMNVEEAVLQMDLIGHDFFVFLNDDTEEVNVVYKRKDGNYGWIEPKI